MTRHGGPPSGWYVGLAHDAKEVLLREHHVHEELDLWIFRTVIDHETAQRIERHYLHKVGTDGSLIGGRPGARQVYVYKKSSRTDP